MADTLSSIRLDKIVETLSHNEIRYLRNRLNSIHFYTDICAHLPVELLLNVSEYLTLEDLMVVRHVSRTWRTKFSSPDFVSGITKMHFRIRWEQTNLNDSAVKEELASWLWKATAIRSRKLRSKSLSMSMFHYHRNGQLLWINSPLDHQYHLGRIAYNYGDGIVVHDLKAGQSSQPAVYLDPSRSPLLSGQWVLSDRFLVARGTGRLNLIAWSLEDEQIHQVQLHSMTKHISVRGSYAAIITNGHEVLIWKIGGSIKSIDRPPSNVQIPGVPQGEGWMPEAMVFHPSKEGHMFIFHAGDLVQSFREGKYMASFSVNYAAELEFKKTYRDQPIRLIGSKGLCSRGWDLSVEYAFRSKVIKTFDMYTCEFGTLHQPWEISEPLQEQVLPFWSENIGDRPHVLKDDSMFYEDTELWSGTMDDDSIEVLFGGSGYVVWTFDETELPVAGSLLDLSLDVAPEDRPFLLRWD